MEDKYHGRGSFPECKNQFAVNLERFKSKEECERAMHPALWSQGYRPRKCEDCRGWYISADG